MSKARDELIKTLWHGIDPFADFDPAWPVDMQGWGWRHDYLSSSVIETRPKVVVDLGVWKGMSTIAMAKALKEHDIDGVVVAVDTWLGSSEHWLNQKHFPSLKLISGRQTLQNTFMANVRAKNLQEFIVPFPIDSVNASVIFGARKIAIDLLHLDAGHDYRSVLGDLHAWWPMLAPDGVLIGDDYHLETYWPGVKRAFDQFFAGMDVGFEHHSGKCRVRKTIASKAVNSDLRE